MKKASPIHRPSARLPAIALVLACFALPAFTAHCGGGATCDAVCDNFMDKCYGGPVLGGDDFEDLVRNDCLEQCGTRAQAVPEPCGAARDDLLSCIASAPSIDCNDAQRSSSCTSENERLLACSSPSNGGSTSSTSTNASGATTAGGPTCTRDDDCPGAVCNGKLEQCATPGPVGFPCFSDDECQTDLCNGKLEQCSTPQPDGSPCFSDDECTSDLCNGKLEQCSTPGPAGSPCFSDDECQSGTCNTQTEVCA